MNNSDDWTNIIADSGVINDVTGLTLMKTPSFKGKNIKLLLHLLAWTILLALPLYFIRRWQFEKDFIWLYYINLLINGIIFYSNYLVLIPHFFFSKRRINYYLSVIALIACFYVVSDVSNRLVFKYVPGKVYAGQLSQGNSGGGINSQGVPRFFDRPPFRQMHLYNYTLNSIFLVFFSLGMRILERHANIEKVQKELEREKLNSELASLKNQVSPHFFFNTLNNIYSLISINAADSQKAVLKLSKLMRYLIYETEQGNTQLSKEIEFMNNYIDLMKLRMSNKIDLKVSFPEIFEDKSIPPLLFIPFIENAFKHGISYKGKSYIDISLAAGNGSINFTCRNSLAKMKEDSERSINGIGLDNVSKRLNLLFPGKHELKIDKSDKTFDVSLFISLT